MTTIRKNVEDDLTNLHVSIQILIQMRHGFAILKKPNCNYPSFYNIAKTFSVTLAHNRKE